MPEKRKLSILICHCSYPEELAEITHQLLQEVLPDNILTVRVICPDKYEEYVTDTEKTRKIYWPRAKIKKLLEYILPETDIFLASESVLDSIKSIYIKGLKRGNIGRGSYQQISLIYSELKRIFNELKIPFDQNEFDKNVLPLLQFLADEIYSRNFLRRSFVGELNKHLKKVGLPTHA